MEPSSQILPPRTKQLIDALANFAVAWSNLTKLTAEDDDLDLTEAYPFYLLNFEEITPNVVQWCKLNISKLIKGSAGKMLIMNPDCIQCDNVGKCGSLDCQLHTYIPFDKEKMTKCLSSAGYEVDKSTPEEIVYAAYVGYVDAQIQRRNDNANRVQSTNDTSS
jgi:hypothetical protein